MEILDLFADLEGAELFESTDSHNEALFKLLKYLSENVISEDILSEIFERFPYLIRNKLINMAIIRNNRLSEKFVEKYFELLSVELVLEYQNLTLDFYLRNKAFLAGKNVTLENLEKLIEKKRIKIDDEEKSKFNLYFNMKK